MLSLILTVTELLVMLGHGRGAAGGEPTLGAAEVGEVVAAGGHAPPALDTRVPETVINGLEYKIGRLESIIRILPCRQGSGQ